MNYIYLAVMAVFGLYALVQFTIDDTDVLQTHSFIRFFTTIMACVGFVGMAAFSAVVGGDDLIDIKPATNVRVGDELVIQSHGWPTQITTDIGFIDKPVQIKRLTKRNVWGRNVESKYIVEEVEVENSIN